MGNKPADTPYNPINKTVHYANYLLNSEDIKGVADALFRNTRKIKKNQWMSKWKNRTAVWWFGNVKALRGFTQTAPGVTHNTLNHPIPRMSRSMDKFIVQFANCIRIKTEHHPFQYFRTFMDKLLRINHFKRPLD